MNTLEVAMKRIAFSLIVLFSSQAFAEWTYLVRSQGGGAEYYVDNQSIKRGSRAWVLTNFSQPLNGIASSSIGLAKVDCQGERIGWLSQTFYPEIMGKGTPISTEPESNWEFVIPNSVDSVLLKKICKK